MIKAVFFDLYNTLVTYDPPREETQARILKEFGIEASPESLRRPIMLADDFIYKERSRLPPAAADEGSRVVVDAQEVEIP